jgi:hypothetical protein
MKTAGTTTPTVAIGRTLVLADWKTDPQGVLAVCAGRPEVHNASIDLVVPATLHGIDWVGDPYANAPCARRVLDELSELLGTAGIAVATATVDDPDPVAAAIDAALSQPVQSVVVCELERRVKLFDLGARVSRAVRVPVLSVQIPPVQQTRRGWQRLQRGECGMTQRLRRASKPITA